jgi:phosphatidylserine/phosphatidylglycerophosphate/cardiolipin synthase-like enzyme
MKRLPSFAIGLATVLLFAEPALETEPPPAMELSINTCFAPEGQCAAVAIREINAAEQRILVNAYALTAGAGFAEALARAKGRGVDVEVIADRNVPCERHSGITLLTEAAIPVWIDHKVRLAHAKVMVIDGAVTLLGSYNWTIQASFNSEDLNVVRSPAVAAQYEQHWRYRRDASAPYRMRDDWCPARAEMIR